MANSNHNIPRDVMHKILLSEMTNTTMWHDVISYVFHSRFPEFLGDEFSNVFSSDINLKYLYINLENMEKVVDLKKNAKYKHLLKNMYNGKMFYNNVNMNESPDTRQEKEMMTLRVLLDFYDYVKDVHDIDKQRYNKTNLNVWALYPLFDYICMRLLNDHEGVSVFKESDIRDLVCNRIYNIKRDLNTINNCSPDIKYRLSQLLTYLSHELDI